MDKENLRKSKFDEAQLLKSSTVFYGVILVVGLMIGHYLHDSLATAWAPAAASFSVSQLIILGCLGAGLISIMSYVMEDLASSYRSVREYMVSLVGQLSLMGALYLGVLSAVAEEVLFRMAIQPSVGVFVTSLMFALLHLGPGRALSVWSLLAFLSSLILGWTYDATANLWPAVIGHIGVNLISVLRFRVLYRAGNPDQGKANSKDVRGIE